MIDSNGNPNEVVYVPSYVVNTCFCIEIGLKYLLEKEGKTARGHDLKFLHDQLKQSTKDLIDDYIKQFSQDQSKYHQWFVANLDEVKKGFENWRYFYEPTLTTNSGSSVVNA